VESQGMLLAAEEGDVVEVIFAPQAQPGDRVHLAGEPATAGEAPGAADLPVITVDTFFSVPFNVADGVVRVKDVPLQVNDTPLVTFRAKNGGVH
jgi:tRNA-binding EMAP/Myf-like protein